MTKTSCIQFLFCDWTQASVSFPPFDSASLKSSSTGFAARGGFGSAVKNLQFFVEPVFSLIREIDDCVVKGCV